MEKEIRIELIKEENLLGQTWYKIYLDNFCAFSSESKEEAIDKFELMKKRKQDGFPKKEIILIA